VHVRGPNHVVRNNIIDLDGPDLLPAFTVAAGYRRANVAVDAPPIHNHNYTYENNLVRSSSGSIFQVSGRPDAKTFKRVDENVYFNPRGAYSFGAIGSREAWQGMGFDTGTRFVDPLFVDRKQHDFRLQPDSPARALGFQEIETSQIGLKEGFPYDID
jgi:hypothetical protein